MNLNDLLGADDADWMQDPRRPCATAHAQAADMWFHPSADLHAEGKRLPRGWARDLCAGCPVVNQCLQYALDNREDWGVWGGTTAPERARLRRKAVTDAA